MTSSDKQLFLCSCEKTMKMDPQTVADAAGFGTVQTFDNLCRREIGAFEKAAAKGTDLCVACQQESPLFAEIAEESGAPAPRFVNLRETAGWTKDKASVAPKMAALLAGSAIETTTRLKSIESDGLCLVLGAGQQAFDTATLLNRTLSVTLVLTAGADEIVLPSVLDFPIYQGKARQLEGAFGQFSITLDQHAAMLPSSRGAPQFAMARNGVTTRCSVVFDMSGANSLVSRKSGRDGYIRVNPSDTAEVMRQAFDAAELFGTFEKPIYVQYDADICAHSRSTKIGCSKCLDNCPAGAITPDGDHVSYDLDICGGCGNCAAHCPTGAVTYAYPDLKVQIQRLHAMSKAYFKAGGKAPALLVHDEKHGAPLINAMARFGKGLPAQTIPFAVHSTSGIGHAFLSAAYSAGFSSVVIAGDPQKQDEYDALRAELSLMDALLDGFGNKAAKPELVFEADPDALEAVLWEKRSGKAPLPTYFEPIGKVREITIAAISALQGSSKKPALFALPESAPYGEIAIDIAACTLCMACVSACPADAIRDNPDKPQLRFVEAACVQCGLCKSTCPESAISLNARFNADPATMQPRTLHEDEPARCTRCDTPFASKKMLDRIANQLSGKHWMFERAGSADLIHMCESCRLEVLSEDGKDPFDFARRPKPRTTDDYLPGEKKPLKSDDFLS